VLGALVIAPCILQEWALVVGGIAVLGITLSFCTIAVINKLDGPKPQFSIERMLMRYPVPFVCCYLLDRSKLWESNGVMDPDHMFVFIPFILVGLIFVALDGLLLPVTFILFFVLCYRDARRREIARVMHDAIKESNKPKFMQICTATGRWSWPKRGDPPRYENQSPRP
jgi:hypothetical protein